MSLVPTAIEPAAVAIACRPLEQNRLIVCAGHLLAEIGEQRDQARDVEALLALGHRAAEDDVVDLALGLRHARQQAADHVGGELVGTLRRQACPCDRGRPRNEQLLQ